MTEVRDRGADERTIASAPRPAPSQDAIAIIAVVIAVGVALGGLHLDQRSDARADRAAWQAESRQMRDEARTDREKFQNHMEALQRQMVDSSREQARLAAALEPKE